MPLPLLISKQENCIFPDEYKLGWLFENDNDKEAYWMIWGSSKNKECALSAAKDVIEKQGDRDVFISDTPLPKHLTKQQFLNLQKLSIQ